MTATRRGLLLMAGLLAVPDGGTRTEDNLAVLGRRLRGLLNGPGSARRIAAAYLAGVGAPDYRHAAVDLDMAEVLAPANGIAGATALRTWMGTRIRADFETGAVIDVDGWRLSRTEVGACLLAASVA